MQKRALLLTLSLLPVQLLGADDGYGVDGYYRSDTFAYEIGPSAEIWAPWSALEDDYAHADSGYLGVFGYGSVVMPVCWQGERPSQSGLLDAFLSCSGSWPRKIDRGDDRWVLGPEYTSGRDEFGPDDYRGFTDLHRKLVGAIELGIMIG